MRHQIIASARRIAGELKTSENECDAALAAKARLVATMLDARRETGLPAQTCRKALENVVEAVSYATKARGALLDAHGELAQLNLRELSTGDLSECPEDWRRSFSLVEAPATRAA